MKKIFISTLAIGISMACTAQKASKNWQALFNGKNTSGWHNYGKTTIGSGWKVVDGTLHLDASTKKDWQSRDGGDIVFEKEFTNFHLSLEWKIAKDGNSGIMFYVHEDTAQYAYPWMTGLEMQVLDNNGHPDAKIFKHRAGDLYDLIPCRKETVKPAGQWNHAEVICNEGVLTFKLNGTVVVTTTLWNDTWKKMVAESKFNAYPGFGTYQKGKIALQDHGDNVWYRNIKVREL